MSCAQHYAHPCTHRANLAKSNEKLWTIVGEFSLATPAELNCDNREFFASQQIGVYETGSGWFMWAHNHQLNWKEWSFKHSYENNWIKPNGPNSAQC